MNSLKGNPASLIIYPAVVVRLLLSQKEKPNKQILLLRGYTLYRITTLIGCLSGGLLQVMLSGLHELANKMSDPFGDDESDLNVDAFLNTAVEESRRYLLELHLSILRCYVLCFVF